MTLHPARDLVSQREVSRILGCGNAVVGRLAAAGLFGEPVRVGRAIGYERTLVEAVMHRPLLTGADVLPDECRDGVVIARINPVAGTGDALARAAGPWRLGLGRFAILVTLLSMRGRMPLVVTLSGFVLAGGDIVRVVDRADGTAHLVLEDPGAWWCAFDGRRVPTGGGSALWFWRFPLVPQIPRDRPYSAA